MQYGVLLYSLYPGRTPPVTWTCLNSGLNSTQVFRIFSLLNLRPLKVSHCPLSGAEVRAMLPSYLDLPGEHRTAEEQVAWQVSCQACYCQSWGHLAGKCQSYGHHFQSWGHHYCQTEKLSSGSHSCGNSWPGRSEWHDGWNGSQVSLSLSSPSA